MPPGDCLREAIQSVRIGKTIGIAIRRREHNDNPRTLFYCLAAKLKIMRDAMRAVCCTGDS
jgi:hypothetical protein